MSKQSRQEADMAERGWLTVAAAAARLRVDTATVYRQVAAEEIATTKVIGRTYVSEKDVNRLAGPLAESQA